MKSILHIALCALLFAGVTHAAEISSSPGITEPFLDVTLSAAVPGIVTARKFKEGDFVQPGDVLIELDRKLEEIETERRKVLRDQKRGEFESTKQLFSTTKGVSKEDLDKRDAEFRVAAAEHEIAVEQLRRRQVLSPLAGTITEVNIEVGEACQPYQALVRVVDTRRCYFITNIEAKSGASLKPDQTVKLEIVSGAGPVNVTGKISFLSPVVDAASGLQKVKVLFENPDGKIPPGVAGRMFLN